MVVTKECFGQSANVVGVTDDIEGIQALELYNNQERQSNLKIVVVLIENGSAIQDDQSILDYTMAKLNNCSWNSDNPSIIVSILKSDPNVPNSGYILLTKEISTESAEQNPYLYKLLNDADFNERTMDRLVIALKDPSNGGYVEDIVNTLKGSIDENNTTYAEDIEPIPTATLTSAPVNYESISGSKYEFSNPLYIGGVTVLLVIVVAFERLREFYSERSLIIRYNSIVENVNSKIAELQVADFFKNVTGDYLESLNLYSAIKSDWDRNIEYFTRIEIFVLHYGKIRHSKTMKKHLDEFEVLSNSLLEEIGKMSELKTRLVEFINNFPATSEEIQNEIDAIVKLIEQHCSIFDLGDTLSSILEASKNNLTQAVKQYNGHKMTQAEACILICNENIKILKSVLVDPENYILEIKKQLGDQKKGYPELQNIVARSKELIEGFGQKYSGITLEFASGSLVYFEDTMKKLIVYKGTEADDVNNLSVLYNLRLGLNHQNIQAYNNLFRERLDSVNKSVNKADSVSSENSKKILGFDSSLKEWDKLLGDNEEKIEDDTEKEINKIIKKFMEIKSDSESEKPDVISLREDLEEISKKFQNLYKRAEDEITEIENLRSDINTLVTQCKSQLQVLKIFENQHSEVSASTENQIDSVKIPSVGEVDLMSRTDARVLVGQLQTISNIIQALSTQARNEVDEELRKQAQKLKAAEEQSHKSIGRQITPSRTDSSVGVEKLGSGRKF